MAKGEGRAGRCLPGFGFSALQRDTGLVLGQKSGGFGVRCATLLNCY